MNFNSWDFIIFLFVIYGLYLLFSDFRQQNLLLLIGSYYFYSAWDYRFLSLIITSTVVDYFCGILIHESADKGTQKKWLLLSICVNLGLLGIFKYYGFFISSLEPILQTVGIPINRLYLNLILPVGISFYTFQTLSYTVDIYRGQLKPTRNFLNFALFVAFFPQLVAGPIERAKNLLPQIEKHRTIDEQNTIEGITLIIWGLWKKIVIADNLAYIADGIFLNSVSASSVMMYLGIVAFAWQVYCDFSAYSDIARGTAKLIGFDLMLNFNIPYFAASPSDLWRRWHISLSTWFRDYVYIPLGGNRGTQYKVFRNLFLSMALCGLWHGAGWNFVGWGMFIGAGLIMHDLLTSGKRASRKTRSILVHFLSVIGTFHFFLAGLMIFRCSRHVYADGRMRDDSFTQMIEVATSYKNGLGFDQASLEILLNLSFFVLPILAIQFFQYIKNDHLFFLKISKPWQSVLASFIILWWMMWGIQGGDSFVYFQF